MDALRNTLKARNNASSTTVWFVRHGQSEGNALRGECTVNNDCPLTKTGEEEATAIARYFRKIGRTPKLFSSPVGRAHRSAEIVAENLGISLSVKDGLKERNWGEWGDTTWNALAEKLAPMTLEERYSFVPPGGESWEAMERRLIDCMMEIVQESDGHDDILIMTHRGCLRALLPLFASAGRHEHEAYSMNTGTLSAFSVNKDSFELIGHDPKTADA